MPPDTELLRGHGWAIVTCHGPYCLAWKENREVLFVWQNGGWFQIYEVSRGARLAG